MGSLSEGSVVKMPKLKELILQSLAHERGGVKIYQTALTCAHNEDLKDEWQRYLQQTKSHVQILTNVCTALRFDPEEHTKGTQILQAMGKALVNAIEEARSAGDAEAAEVVACECVVLAETKDHLDWELIGAAAEALPASQARALKDAYDEVEDQEDEHLYRTRGWCRELWLKSLGLKAVLPPPEERKHVKTAIGAARAEQSRSKMR
jgi:rubrerythrin